MKMPKQHFGIAGQKCQEDEKIKKIMSSLKLSVLDQSPIHDDKDAKEGLFGYYNSCNRL